MAEIRDADPITFDFEAAERLAWEFRKAADLLNEHAPYRNGLATTARREWRGVFDVQFGARMIIYTADGHRLADAMDVAADQVDELARLAREEQDRRTVARQWKEDHDAWEREQENDGFFENFVDGFSSDEPVEPELTPTDPPRIILVDAPPGIR